MDIIAKLQQELQIQRWQAEAAVRLIDEGNTIPFISRYRKEATGSLNDEVLRNLEERLRYLRNLEEKKEQVLESIGQQGQLTEELRAKLLAAETLVVVEDLYRPYRPKRRTRASAAKERGLQGLADWILAQEASRPALEEAAAYINPEKEVHTAQEALQGAKDILAEAVSDDADHRLYIRTVTMEEGKLVSTARDEKAQSVYEMYYQYEEPVKKAAGHRILALNRGEKEKFLNVRIEAPADRILRYLAKKVILRDDPVTTPILEEVVADSYERLIAPAIEREIRNELTERAEDGAISVFGKNLEQLLMQPPIAGRVVLGWDPAFRTGCKLAVVDETGKVLDTRVIFPTAPQNKVEEAKAELKRLIRKYRVSLISLGNGTASRESEQVIVELIRELKQPLQYVIVNEAGASVYSASKLATEEFPQFDVGQRSAASIARRLQDPMAELVKIDPRSIGVGQYQHDMNQKKLGETLDGVVEDSVNRVGVDLNTASASLLEHISGVSKPIARNIVEYRESNGRFRNRRQLLKVPKLGPKAFEQCAGFLRITDGDNPLDATSVHPESYEAAMRVLEKLGMTLQDVKKLQAAGGSGQREADGAEAGAARQSAGIGTAVQQAGNGNGRQQAGIESKAGSRQTGAGGRTGENSGRRNGQPLVIRNTNTAMGKALAAAFGSLENEKNSGGSSAGKAGTAAGRQNSGAPGQQQESTAAQRKAEKHRPGEKTGGTVFAGGLAGRIPDPGKLAEELGIGEPTLADILKELEKPARDPREDMPAPILRNDVLEMKDLKPGMILKGTVRNVIDFGAFVDIGVHQDGLVHISRITDRFIKHPLEAVSVGDIVTVKVLDVDPVKKRISLTMRLEETPGKN